MDLETVFADKNIPENEKEKLRNFLVENCKNNNELYLIFNEEYLFVGKHKLTVSENNKMELNILVYYPKIFPKKKPEFYFEHKNNIFISKEYEEVINKINLKINPLFFCDWDNETLNLEDILLSFQNTFNINYPFIRKKENNNYHGNCKF